MRIGPTHSGQDQQLVLFNGVVDGRALCASSALVSAKSMLARDNTLVRATWSHAVSPHSYLIMLMALVKYSPGVSEVVIGAGDLRNLAVFRKTHRVYEYLERAGIELTSNLRLDLASADPVGTAPADRRRRAKSFGGVMFGTYYYQNGALLLCVNDRIAPLLHNLTTNFTTTRLSAYAELPTFAAMRLYDYLCSHLQGSDCASVYIRQDQLRELCAVADSKYSDVTDLQKRVLRPAVEAMNAKAGLSVRCVDRRVNRRIDGWMFGIARDETVHPPAERLALLMMLKRCRVSAGQARALAFGTVDVDRMFNAIALTMRRASALEREGKQPPTGGYLVDAVKNGYIISNAEERDLWLTRVRREMGQEIFKASDESERASVLQEFSAWAKSKDPRSHELLSRLGPQAQNEATDLIAHNLYPWLTVHAFREYRSPAVARTPQPAVDLVA